MTGGSGPASVLVAKALHSAGYEVHASDVRGHRLGLRSRYTHQFHLIPARDFAEYEAGLLQLVCDLRPQVLFPFTTTCVAAVSRNRNRFAELTGVLAPDWQAFWSAYDKAACGRICALLGIPVPRSFTPQEAAAWLPQSAGTDSIRRLVVKPSLDVGGARGVRYVETVSELGQALAGAAPGLPPPLIQEYIPGDSTAMRTVVVLVANGLVQAAFTMQKTRQSPPSGGNTVTGVSTADRASVDLVMPFFATAHWSGLAEAEFKYDERDGRMKLMEINPRLPGYVGFPQRSGMDFIGLTAQLAEHGSHPLLPAPFPSYAVGANFLQVNPFLSSVLDELRAAPSMGSRARILKQARLEWRSSRSDFGEHLLDPEGLLLRLFPLPNPAEPRVAQFQIPQKESERAESG